jgi:hypothetical protein
MRLSDGQFQSGGRLAESGRWWSAGDLGYIPITFIRWDEKAGLQRDAATAVLVCSTGVRIGELRISMDIIKSLISPL